MDRTSTGFRLQRRKSNGLHPESRAEHAADMIIGGA
jgi:hypothetical protein